MNSDMRSKILQTLLWLVVLFILGMAVYSLVLMFTAGGWLGLGVSGAFVVLLGLLAYLTD